MAQRVELGQRTGALEVTLGLRLRRLGLGEGGVRLGERSLVRLAIDREQDLACLHPLALNRLLALQHAADAGTDFYCIGRLKLGRVLQRHRHGVRRDPQRRDPNSIGCRWSGSAAASGDQRGEDGESGAQGVTERVHLNPAVPARPAAATER
jgi:hypothetical protein